MPRPTENDSSKHLAMRVVDYVQTLLERGELGPGDKLAPERDLSRQLRISRASLRSGIGTLAAIGIIEVRHGIGNFVADGPATIGRSSLRLLGALHGFQPWQMFESRLILESNLAALAAERASKKQMEALAAELDRMSESETRPTDYLLHDISFHRLIAEASGNPILAALVETMTASLYDSRKKTVERTSNLRQTTESHHKIFREIRAGKSAAARKAMEQHLRLAEAAEGKEKPRRQSSKRSSRPASRKRG